MAEGQVRLKGREAFATGNNRACYVHEDFPGKCLKVVRTDVAADSGKGVHRAGRDDNEEEFHILKKLHRRLDVEAGKVFPACDGFVETDLGRALVTELYTEPDGRISPTLDHVLAREEVSAGVWDGLERFKETWVRVGVRSRQLNLHNLIVQETGPGIYGIRVIDGLGAKGGVLPKPFHLFLRWKARRKIRKLERKMLKFVAMSSEERASMMRTIRQDERGGPLGG